MVGRVQLVLNKVKHLIIFAVDYIGQTVKKVIFGINLCSLYNRMSKI